MCIEKVEPRRSEMKLTEQSWGFFSGSTRRGILFNLTPDRLVLLVQMFRLALPTPAPIAMFCFKGLFGPHSNEQIETDCAETQKRRIGTSLESSAGSGHLDTHVHVANFLPRRGLALPPDLGRASHATFCQSRRVETLLLSFQICLSLHRDWRQFSSTLSRFVARR